MDSGSNKKGSSGAILIMIFCLIVMIYLIGKVSDKEEHSKYTNVTTESTTELCKSIGDSNYGMKSLHTHAV